MLLLSCLFTVVLMILAYALRADKGKHTAYARKDRSSIHPPVAKKVSPRPNTGTVQAS